MTRICKYLRPKGRTYAPLQYTNRVFARFQSSHSIGEAIQKNVQPHTSEKLSTSNTSLLKRIPTPILFRSLILDVFFQYPLLMRGGLAFMKQVAKSKSFLLNPDRNFFLRAVIRPLIYDHFCAGVDKREVESKVAEIKKIGFTGVILCYGREIVVEGAGSQKATSQDARSETSSHVQQWRDSNLKTLEMMGAGDYLALKFTGAGATVTKALAERADPPPEFAEAIDAICQKAASQNSIVWVDAEQHVFQPTIDAWTVSMMRRYNRNKRMLVLNTVQSYLKSTRETVSNQLRLAQTEGWTLGIKLVRGAYIGSDPRHLIHDTKADTDDCFNGITRDILMKSFPGFSKESFPDVHLFLASHNAESVRLASKLANDLILNGELDQSPSFGMLQGMADDIGCELLEVGDRARESSLFPQGEKGLQIGGHKVFKYMPWGTIQECTQYLVRRAVENQGATDKLKGNGSSTRDELFRRMRRAFSTASN